MYIDPNTGGIIFQALAAIVEAAPWLPSGQSLDTAGGLPVALSAATRHNASELGLAPQT